MTLQEIETQIGKLERCEVELTGPPSPLYSPEREIAAEACDQLYWQWGRLRRTLWAAPYRAWARELQERCRVAIDRMSAEHGFMATGVPPRFPGYTDSAGNTHPAID